MEHRSLVNCTRSRLLEPVKMFRLVTNQVNYSSLYSLYPPPDVPKKIALR